MNIDLQHELARRADAAEVPAFDPRSVVADGERLVRRRRTLAAAGTVVAVALAIGTTSLLVDPDPVRPEPAGPVEVPKWTGSSRPLTYGQGQVLHLGDREIDTGMDFLELDLTDEGAALVTLDGAIWFTDGATVERIGTTLGVRRVTRSSIGYHVGRPAEWVAGGDAGSLLAWMEFTDQRVDRPELVVYDTAVGGVVARQPVPVADGNSALVADVVDRQVFVEEDDRGSFDPTPVFRYDLDSGDLAQVSDTEVDQARRSGVPALVVGSATHGEVVHTPARPLSGRGVVGTLGVRDSRLDGLRDPHTGDAVEISVPETYVDGDMWFTQWLDDDRFVLSTGAGLGELLLCSISAARCDPVVEGLTLSGAGPAITPGDALRGGEHALGRAIEAYRERQ